jgi:hypothetical protein
VLRRELPAFRWRIRCGEIVFFKAGLFGVTLAIPVPAVITIKSIAGRQVSSRVLHVSDDPIPRPGPAMPRARLTARQKTIVQTDVLKEGV